MSRIVTETEARQVLSALRSPAAAADPVVLQRLLAEVAPGRGERGQRGQRSRHGRARLVAAVAVMAVLALLGGVIVIRSQASRQLPYAGPMAQPRPYNGPGIVSPGPGLRTIAGGITNAASLVDVNGVLWESSPGAPETQVTLKAISVKPGTGPGLTVSNPRPHSLDLAGEGSYLYGLDVYTGTVTIEQTPSGTRSSVVSRKLDAFNLAARGGADPGVWTVSCCDASATKPGQRIQRRDPATLLPAGPGIDVPDEGQGGYLAAGDGGVWFVPEDGSKLYRVDTDGDRPSSVQKLKTLDPPEFAGETQRIDALAVGPDGPVFVDSNNNLVFYTNGIGATDSLPLAPSLGQPDYTPVTALAVSSTSVYVAFGDRVLVYDLATHRLRDTLDLGGVTALSVGTDGVWAAHDATVTQLSTS